MKKTLAQQNKRASRVKLRLEAIKAAVKAFNSAPVTGPILSDKDLYDEDGLPR